MKNVLVCGAGALGGWVSTYLAIDGRDDIHVAVVDFDKVTDRNIMAGTQNFTREQINSLKVEALQLNIYKQYGRTIGIVPAKVTEKNFKDILAINGPKYDVIVDAFDNFEARNVTVAPQTGIPVVHCGFGKYSWSILWNDGYKAPKNDESWDVCDLPGAASFVRMVASVGSLVIQDFLKTGKKREFVGNSLSVREVK